MMSSLVKTCKPSQPFQNKNRHNTILLNSQLKGFTQFRVSLCLYSLKLPSEIKFCIAAFNGNSD